MNTLDEILTRWDSGDGKPYKGQLIDWNAYEADQSNIGCMCAQGQVLHLMGGWSQDKLRNTAQEKADRETAKLLGISISHAILLRRVNDSVDGAPSIVLTHPEKVLGDQAHIVLAFWRHLDRMTDEQWAAARDAACAAAWAAPRDAARDAAWAAAGDAAGAAPRDAARDAARDAPWAAAWAAASYACSEIQGARIMRDKGQAFYFLPMFGFADPEAVLAADEQARSA